MRTPFTQIRILTYKDDWSIVISDDQIRKVVNELGSIIYRYDDLMRKEAERRFASGVKRSVFAGARSGILYIEMDGAMFNTRTTNNGSSWRENKLGAVFNSKDIVYHKTKTGQEVHRILKRQFVSYVGDADTFEAHLYALALENGFESAEKIVIISDGAKWIKGFKEKYCAGMDVVHILDFSHLKENIYKFAKVFIRGKLQKIRWAEKLATLIIEGRLDEAYAMTEPYKDKHRAGVPNIFGYLKNNRESIDYPTYIKAGYFIGSGVIESGNRYVMQERLKLPGMRWDVDAAQRVLALKCKYDSGLWQSLIVPLVYKEYGLTIKGVTNN